MPRQKKLFALGVSAIFFGCILFVVPVIQSLWDLRRSVAVLEGLDLQLDRESSDSSTTTSFGTLNFQVPRAGDYSLAWVEPNKYIEPPELRNLSTNFTLKSGENILETTTAPLRHRNEDLKTISLQEQQDYSLEIRVAGPKAAELLKDFQVKVSLNQEDLLTHVASSFKFYTLIASALLILGFGLLRMASTRQLKT